MSGRRRLKMRMLETVEADEDHGPEGEQVALSKMHGIST